MRYFQLCTDSVLLGGLPFVVLKYVQTKTFEGVLAAQRQLVQDYREDVRKYAGGLDKAKIISVFDNLAPQLAKENKKFQYARLAKGARSLEYF